MTAAYEVATGKMFVIEITSPPPAGSRKPVISRYAVLADSKEHARARFVQMMPSQLTAADAVFITCYEEGIARLA